MTENWPSRLLIVPMTLRAAGAFVDQYHRHHSKPRGHKFSIGCKNKGVLVGVGIAGRPVSRYLDDGYTLEITRLCSDGTRNVCSKLYGAICRIAKIMGYHKVVTYILCTENGTSLKASGFICDLPVAGGGSWSCPSRHRVDTSPTVKKKRWIKVLRRHTEANGD